MTDSDTIIKDLPNIEVLTSNYTQFSSFCSQVEKLKDDIFKINEKNVVNINDLVLFIGNTERHIRYNYAKEIRNLLELFNRNDTFGDGENSINKMKEIIGKLNITVNLYRYLDEFYIEKKKRGEPKTYIKLIDCKLFGTGNLSTSLILKATYLFNINNEYKIGEIYTNININDIY